MRFYHFERRLLKEHLHPYYLRNGDGKPSEYRISQSPFRGLRRMNLFQMGTQIWVAAEKIWAPLVVIYPYKDIFLTKHSKCDENLIEGYTKNQTRR
jgi:hypothetical protein